MYLSKLCSCNFIGNIKKFRAEETKVRNEIREIPYRRILIDI